MIALLQTPRLKLTFSGWCGEVARRLAWSDERIDVYRETMRKAFREGREPASFAWDIAMFGIADPTCKRRRGRCLREGWADGTLDTLFVGNCERGPRDRRYRCSQRACVVPRLSVCMYGRRTREGFALVIESDVARSDHLERAWQDHAEHAFASVRLVREDCPYCMRRAKEPASNAQD